MKLFINTSDLENIIFALFTENGIQESRTRVTYNENDKTLTLLDEFLKQQNVTLKDISELWVCTGPGSFTGVRVGVTLAKAFGLAHNIPVYGIKKEYVPAELAYLPNTPKEIDFEVQYNRPPF